MPGYKSLLSLRNHAQAELLTAGDDKLRRLFAEDGATADDPPEEKPKKKPRTPTADAKPKPISVQLPMENGETRVLQILSPISERDAPTIPCTVADIRDCIAFIRSGGVDDDVSFTGKRPYNKLSEEQRRQPLRKRYPDLYGASAEPDDEATGGESGNEEPSGFEQD